LDQSEVAINKLKKKTRHFVFFFGEKTGQRNAFCELGQSASVFISVSTLSFEKDSGLEACASRIELRFGK
jgi:hypothetical protein